MLFWNSYTNLNACCIGWLLLVGCLCKVSRHFCYKLKNNFLKKWMRSLQPWLHHLWNRKWNGVGTIFHSLTLWGNEKTVGITITTRNHGLFDLKTRLKTSHFDIWSIWPLNRTRQTDLNMLNLIGGFF
jgi:hypothetical protein